ncbi:MULTISPECIES: class I SAM-dependent methyltransferase [Aeromonas]|uniref:class I SAM-dependent methyltransferase n=1 Tax=Aeromonas TaxID=642 RepID=UPI001E631393|nr:MULTISPECIES: class I SAM-dependent methyltransferase [Aeromonas]
MPHAPAPAHDAAPRPALVAGAHALFLALLGSGRHLLEAGCGAGEDLRLFRQQGLTVTAFDTSRAQAAAASRLCGQPVRVCRFEQMQSVVPYDGIWASGSLPCLPEHEIAPALGHLATLLKAGGPLYASFPHGEGEPLPRSGEYPLQTRLDEAGLRRLIAPLPFTLHHNWVGEDEVNGPWLHALLVRR